MFDGGRMFKIIDVVDKRGNHKKEAIKEIREICPDMTGDIINKELMEVGSRFCFLWSGGAGRMMRTSPIISIEDSAEKLIVETINSKYILKKI